MKINSRRLKIVRMMTWLLLLALTFSFVALCVLSASNYVDVAYAKLSVEVTADVAMEASGLDPSGEVSDATVFYFNVTMNVSNPSVRDVKLQFVTFQSYIENYINEDSPSGTIPSYATTLIESQNYQAETGLVGPQSVRTFTADWVFDKQDLAYFPRTKAILNYVLMNSSRNLHWDEAVWEHYFVFRLVVTGVPTEYYGPDSAYLIELPMVERTQGVYHGS